MDSRSPPTDGLRERREAEDFANNEFNRVKRAKLEKERLKTAGRRGRVVKGERQLDRERANRASAAASRAKIVCYARELEKRTDSLEANRNLHRARADCYAKKLAALRVEARTLKRVLRALWEQKDPATCAYLVDSDALFLLASNAEEDVDPDEECLERTTPAQSPASAQQNLPGAPLSAVPLPVTPLPMTRLPAIPLPVTPLPVTSLPIATLPALAPPPVLRAPPLLASTPAAPATTHALSRPPAPRYLPPPLPQRAYALPALSDSLPSWGAAPRTYTTSTYAKLLDPAPLHRSRQLPPARQLSHAAPAVGPTTRSLSISPLRAPPTGRR